MVELAGFQAFLQLKQKTHNSAAYENIILILPPVWTICIIIHCYINLIIHIADIHFAKTYIGPRLRPGIAGWCAILDIGQFTCPAIRFEVQMKKKGFM